MVPTLSKVRKNSAFTWFDKLTTGFDKPVLSEAEGLRANGMGIEIAGDFPFVLSLSKHKNGFFSSLLDAASIHKRFQVNETFEHVVGDTRDVIVIFVVRQAACPGNRAGRPDGAAVRRFVEDHVRTHQIIL
jgi:hypothetical protein